MECSHPKQVFGNEIYFATKPWGFVIMARGVRFGSDGGKGFNEISRPESGWKTFRRSIPGTPI
jgi:hypothetical protein